MYIFKKAIIPYLSKSDTNINMSSSSATSNSIDTKAISKNDDTKIKISDKQMTKLYDEFKEKLIEEGLIKKTGGRKKKTPKEKKPDPIMNVFTAQNLKFSTGGKSIEGSTYDHGETSFKIILCTLDKKGEIVAKSYFIDYSAFEAFQGQLKSAKDNDIVSFSENVLSPTTDIIIFEKIALVDSSVSTSSISSTD